MLLLSDCHQLLFPFGGREGLYSVGASGMWVYTYNTVVGAVLMFSLPPTIVPPPRVATCRNDSLGALNSSFHRPG